MNRFPIRITLLVSMLLLLVVLGSATVLAQDEPAPAAVEMCIRDSRERS